MTMDSVEVSKVAAGLTEAQRSRLLAFKDFGPTYAGWGQGSSFASVVRAGLATRTTVLATGMRCYRLTPLGLAVRDHLRRTG